MAPHVADMDFAYFAVRLGWSIHDYEATTAVQRAFIRKEIEKQTVEESELLESAVETALANCRRKRRAPYRLWVKKRSKASPPISDAEVRAVGELMKNNTPWSPWREARDG